MNSLMGAYVKAKIETGISGLSEQKMRADAVAYAATRGAKIARQIDADRAKMLEDLYNRKVKENLTENEYINALMDKGYSATAARRYARTESAIVYNVAESETWMDVGVELVRITDGTGDKFCKFANGSVWTVEDYNAHPLAHPNCVRTADPVPASETKKMRRYVKRPHPDEKSVSEY